jgi:hypothetical protein
MIPEERVFSKEKKTVASDGWPREFTESGMGAGIG